MRSALINRLWKPLVIEWLKKPRVFNYERLRFLVQPGVFHPGFFYSSRILADFVKNTDVTNKRFLDVGCGSGLVALTASRKGAIVTAIDINPLAVECTILNARENGMKVEVYVSDLFQAIPNHRFDLVAVNPPFYRKQASTLAERAWNAGSDLEYFKDFFSTLGKIMHPATEVFMILSDDCDLEKIKSLAADFEYALCAIAEYRKMGEKLRIWRIERM